MGEEVDNGIENVRINLKLYRPLKIDQDPDHGQNEEQKERKGNPSLEQTVLRVLIRNKANSHQVLLLGKEQATTRSHVPSIYLRQAWCKSTRQGFQLIP